MNGAEFKITGSEELMAKLDRNALLAAPVKDFLVRTALIVERHTKELTPVDTGRLRASFTSIIDSSPVPLWAKVSSDVQYAPFVEHDTRAHFPPPHALEGWAHRHGIPVFALAMTIARRGTKGKKMLERGWRESLDKISSELRNLMNKIKGEWDK